MNVLLNLHVRKVMVSYSTPLVQWSRALSTRVNMEASNKQPKNRTPTIVNMHI